MHSFTDRNGKVYDIDLTWSAVKRVRARTGCDLTRLFETADGKETGLLDRFAADPLLLFTVIHAALNLDTPEEEFLNGLDGDAGEAASNAFLEELADFTPRPWKELLKKALEAGEKTRETLSEQLAARLSNV